MGEESAVAGAGAGGGGYWNWDDLPEDVQLQFQEAYFAASNSIYQQEVSRAMHSAQG